MYFAVEYIIHKWTEEDDIGYEVFECNHIDSSAGDISEEFSEYMPICSYAQELLHKEPDGVYKVFIVGSLTWHQSNYDNEFDVEHYISITDVFLLNESVEDYISANPETFITFD